MIVYLTEAPSRAQRLCPHRVVNRRNRVHTSTTVITKECSQCGAILVKRIGKRSGYWMYLDLDTYTYYTTGKYPEEDDS